MAKIETLRKKISKIEEGISFHNSKIAIGGGKSHTDRIIELQKMADDLENQIKRIEENTGNTKSLVTLLMDQLLDLKEIYIMKTVEWAKEEVERNIARREKYYASRREDCNRNDYYTESKWVHNTPSWKFSRTDFPAKMSVLAAHHFDDSIQKLATRILAQGLDESKVSVKNASVGVNIAATITDGTQTIRAWTIVASGMIQRPHYRFLVK